MAEAGAKTQQSPEIPDKLYFRIGEVSRLLGLQPYVLRYWETEFPSLAPKKSGAGHRLYRRKEVELLLEIKQLLYEKRYTIAGARRHLELRGKDRRPKAGPEQPGLFAAPSKPLEEIRKELAALLEFLK